MPWRPTSLCIFQKRNPKYPKNQKKTKKKLRKVESNSVIAKTECKTDYWKERDLNTTKYVTGNIIIGTIKQYPRLIVLGMNKQWKPRYPPMIAIPKRKSHSAPPHLNPLLSTLLRIRRRLRSSNLSLTLRSLCCRRHLLSLLLFHLTSLYVIFVIVVFKSSFIRTSTRLANHGEILSIVGASGTIALMSKTVFKLRIWCFSFHTTVTGHGFLAGTMVSLGWSSSWHVGICGLGIGDIGCRGVARMNVSSWI